MDYECRAISLLCHKYGEGAVIAKVFTEELGLKSFSIKRSGGRKSKNKLSLLESQFLINISGKNNKKKQIQYLNEINLAYAFQDNTFKKKLIRTFISEILSKTLVDSEKNKELFEFVWKTNISIDQAKKIGDAFCLEFMVQLTDYLGIYPSTENIHYDFFNINNGIFTNKEVPGELNLKGINLKYLKKIIKKEEVSIPSENRRELIENVFDYFTCHHYNLSNIKSYNVILSLE